MRNHLKLFTLIVAVTFFSNTTTAQYTPPTLALGLSGLTGSKGNIDVELLSSIIADKQDELKKEIIKRYILNGVGEKSYTLWEFSHNSLNMLLNSRDEKAIQRKLLENAANLALVYGFSEAYLEASAKLGNKQLKSVIQSLPLSMINNNVKAAWKNFDSLDLGIFKNENYNYLFLPAFNPEQNYDAEDDNGEVDDDDAIGFNVMFVDMMYDIIKKNGVLKNLGFMNVSPTDDIQNYSERNKFLSYKAGLKNGDPLKLILDSLYYRASKEISLLTDYYLLARQLYYSDLSLEDFSRAIKKSLGKFAKDSLLNNDSTLNLSLANVIASYQKQNISLNDSVLKAIGYLNDLNLKLNAAANDTTISISNLDYYSFHDKIKPQLVKINPSAGAALEQLELLLMKQLVYQIQSAATDTTILNNLKNHKLSDYGSFILLLINLHNLDKAETYEYILKLIRNAGDVFQDRKMAKYINLVTDNLEKYTIYDKEKNLINLKVDDIILQLYDYFERNRKSKFAVYFSVGLNQSIDMRYSENKYALPSDTSGTHLTNISFASEKIGFKYSLVQFNNDITYRCKKKMYKYMREKPLVTDIHAMVYGSGLLYNVVNAKTNSNFDYILVGYGFGVSFFNSMDLNITTAIPLVAHEPFSFTRRNIITVSFDIKIGEYINAYRKQQLKKNSQTGN